MFKILKMKEWSRFNPKKAEAFDFLGLEDKKTYVDGKVCSHLLPLFKGSNKVKGFVGKG